MTDLMPMRVPLESVVGETCDRPHANEGAPESVVGNFQGVSCK